MFVPDINICEDPDTTSGNISAINCPKANTSTKGKSFEKETKRQLLSSSRSTTTVSSEKHDRLPLATLKNERSISMRQQSNAPPSCASATEISSKSANVADNSEVHRLKAAEDFQQNSKLGLDETKKKMPSKGRVSRPVAATKRKAGAPTTSGCQDFVYDAQMMKILGTEESSVFKYSADGQIFTAPRLMKGVPVRRIDETDSYWKPGWETFQRIWLDKEFWTGITQPERGNLSKKEMRPNNQVKTESWHAPKVLRWFGPAQGVMHPNQIITKDALTRDGICNSTSCYDISLTLEYLQPL